jgi:predicted heme/steroid binding protein
MKKSIFSLFVIFLFVLAGCTGNNDYQSPDASNVDESEVIDEQLPEMTLAELSVYDGRNGAKSYVAVSGLIYDVTDSSYWPNGNHNGFQAGQDLTQPLLTQAPHSIANIQRYPVVAVLISGV